MDETRSPLPGKTKRTKYMRRMIFGAIVIIFLFPTGTRIVALDMNTIFADYSRAPLYPGAEEFVIDYTGRKIRVACNINPNRSTARHWWAQDKRDKNSKGLLPIKAVGEDAFFDDGMAGPTPNLRVLRENVIYQVYRAPNTPHAATDALDRLELEKVAHDFDAKLASHSAGVRTQILFVALDLCIEARLLFWGIVVRIFGVG